MRVRHTSRLRPAGASTGASRTVGEHPGLGLQRAVGNRAAARAWTAPVSHPGERAEVEAERMARDALAPAPRGGAPAGVIRPARHPAAGGAPLPTGEGRPLPPSLLREMEPRFGQPFDDVRVHTGPRAASLATRHRAAAYATGSDLVFGAGRWAPGTAGGRRLLAHELAHVVQHRRGAIGHGRAMRTPDEDEARNQALTAPLTDREWASVESWLARGDVGFEPLTADAEANADLMADALFCSRMLFTHEIGGRREDPLLCVLPEVTRADPRARALRAHVEARGPIVHWPAVPGDDRMAHAMTRLVDVYGYPVNGAAGIVGNLWSESGVLPSRLEGSDRATPLRARNFERVVIDFTPEEVRDRDLAAQTGPRLPGIGLAQWTTANRREGLFAHEYAGRPAGTRILFDMDAQVDYLDAELRARYRRVYAVVTAADVSVDAAADEIVYRFEVPGSVLENGRLRPRTDPQVQRVFAGRRANARRALNAYNATRQP